MKKYLLLMLLSTISFAFSANAQSCCSKSKDKTCCSKKASTSDSQTDSIEGKTSLVADANANDEDIEKFKVYGNCGMCKRTIENALINVEGITKGN